MMTVEFVSGTRYKDNRFESRIISDRYESALSVY